VCSKMVVEGGLQGSPFDFCKRFRLLYIPGDSKSRVLGGAQLLERIS
jgi:hypothetical protein